MYSYGWRDYMPDIARWNGIDQLAESYLSTSTYAYVANNPVLMTDPDGRWMDDTGHITDTTGQTFGLHGSSYRPMMSFSTYDGMHTNEGAGVTDNGNNRIAQGPKPNILKRIGNFFGRLLRRNKGSGVSTFVPSISIGKIPTVEVGEPTRIAEFFSTIEATSVVVGAATLGAVLAPVMMKDPEYNWARDLPFNVPITTTVDEPGPEEMLTLYRGVHGKHPDLINAYMGMAIPWGGPFSAKQHNAGHNNSMYTSWSTSIDMANYSAFRRGTGGIILKQTFPISRLSFFDRHNEGEVQVFGPVIGAQKIKPWNPGTWSPYLK